MDHLDRLARDSARFAKVLADVDPDRIVPSCPGWTAADLLWHLTEVQSFWRAIVETRAMAPNEVEEPLRPPNHEEAIDLFELESSRLQEVLATTGPATAVWTWSDDQSVGFVRRRQAHEALIHRVDAELTAGIPPELTDPEFAADGVDEVISVMMTGVPGWASFAPDGHVVAVEATDIAGRWVIATGAMSGTSPDSGRTYDGIAAGELTSDEPTGTIRGRAADLDFWLWGRRDSAGIAGASHDIDRLRLLAAESTQ